MEILVFWMKDSPESIQAKALVESLGVPVRAFNARDAATGPLLTRYEILEIPTVLIVKGRTVLWSGTGKQLTKKTILAKLEE